MFFFGSQQPVSTCINLYQVCSHLSRQNWPQETTSFLDPLGPRHQRPGAQRTFLGWGPGVVLHGHGENHHPQSKVVSQEGILDAGDDGSQVSLSYPRVNIEKDLQNQWFRKENHLQMVGCSKNRTV